MIEIGIDSFAATFPDPRTGDVLPSAVRMAHLLEEIEIADQSGVDVFGIGEHHRAEFLDSAPVVILAAAAARTKRIRLTSAVTVLSAADPVRVFQEFATLDLISNGRAEIVVGRGSFTEAFPLFGFDLNNYDALFVEKLDLLMTLRRETHPSWQGRFRAPLRAQGVFPQPVQEQLPVWLGVGGTPQSFARAGELGLPLMVGIIGGTFDRLRPLVDLYRKAGAQAGHSPDTLRVGVHAFGFVADTDQAAREAFYPGWHQAFSQASRERGFAAPSRSQFDALSGPEGAFLIGAPDTVAAKLVRANEMFGGVSRFTFQMSTANAATAAMQRSITLVGTEVAPLFREKVGG